jgi:methionyl aminopeptidase
MRAAGKLAHQLLDELEGFIEPGVTTLAIDELVDRLTTEAGALSAPYNYGNFPAHCCTSINETICHGIPGKTELAEGDILNVDVTPKLHGFHGDSSRMFKIGTVSPEAEKLVEVAYQCLLKGIAALSPGCPVSVVGEAIQPFAAEHGFSVVQKYTGHGIGKVFHKDPPIPHMTFDSSAVKLPPLRPGMAFTIEPMINAGGHEAKVLGDNWTVITADCSLSAQWEHTILMTHEGAEVLT